MVIERIAIFNKIFVKRIYRKLASFSEAEFQLKVDIYYLQDLSGRFLHILLFKASGSAIEPYRFGYIFDLIFLRSVSRLRQLCWKVI